MTAKDYYSVWKMLVSWGHSDDIANEMIMDLIRAEAEEKEFYEG